MPNKKNAKKALRQTIKRTESNQNVLRTIRELGKDYRKAKAEGSKDLAGMEKTIQKTLDKAAKKGIIKKNTASRKKSRLLRTPKK